MGEVKILSVNCRGLNGNQKLADVFKYLKEKEYHIYCLQDTHFTKKQEKFIYSQWNGECYFSFSSSNSRGVAILFNKQFEHKVHKTHCDDVGNVLALDITIESQRITLVNLYGPNTDNPTFYENIFKVIEDIGNVSYMLCGDYNLVINPTLDYSNYKHVNNKKARLKLIENIENRQLCDPYRENFPTKRRYTWHRTNPLQQARLDFFLITEDLLTNLKQCDIESSYKSDHSITFLHLTFSKIEHGKGLWKHNNSHLKDEEYLNSIRSKIKEVKKTVLLTSIQL